MPMTRVGVWKGRNVGRKARDAARPLPKPHAVTAVPAYRRPSHAVPDVSAAGELGSPGRRGFAPTTEGRAAGRPLPFGIARVASGGGARVVLSRSQGGFIGVWIAKAVVQLLWRRSPESARRFRVLVGHRRCGDIDGFATGACRGDLATERVHLRTQADRREMRSERLSVPHVLQYHRHCAA